MSQQLEFLRNEEQPTAITLADWAPKKNAELETRVRLDFELPLTDDILARLPKLVKTLAGVIAHTENGVPSLKNPTARFNQTLEFFQTGGHTTPIHTFPGVEIYGLKVWRPTPKDGSTRELYLDFSVNVPAPDPEGQAIVGWALTNMRGTVFFKTYPMQPALPGIPAAPPKRRSRRGQEAAANDAAEE